MLGVCWCYVYRYCTCCLVHVHKCWHQILARLRYCLTWSFPFSDAVPGYPMSRCHKLPVSSWHQQQPHYRGVLWQLWITNQREPRQYLVRQALRQMTPKQTLYWSLYCKWFSFLWWVLMASVGLLQTDGCSKTKKDTAMEANAALRLSEQTLTFASITITIPFYTFFGWMCHSLGCQSSLLPKFNLEKHAYHSINIVKCLPTIHQNVLFNKFEVK